MGAVPENGGGSPYDYWHVILRSRGRQEIFSSDDDRKQFLELIHRAQRRTGICILGYCLLASEIHFIVQVIHGTTTKSRFVQRIKSQYARRVHTDSRGGPQRVRKHLFVRRYRSKQLALSVVQQALDDLHQMPVDQGLTPHQNIYLWSSRRAHMRSEEVPWLFVGWGLSDLIRAPDFPWSLPLSGAAAKQFVLQLAEATSHKINLPTAELFSRKRSRRVTLVRAVVSYHALRWGVTLKCVANVLKGESSSTLSQSTLTAAIDHYEPLEPDLFKVSTQELLAQLPYWRMSRTQFEQGPQGSRSD